MYKSAFVFLCAVGIVVAAYASNLVNRGFDPNVANNQPFSEIPCTVNGGICVASNDCPAGKLAPVKGLCPVQQKKGVECCYGVGLSETRCKANGGDCVSKTFQCPKNLIFDRATDCGSNEKCCRFV